MLPHFLFEFLGKKGKKGKPKKNPAYLHPSSLPLHSHLHSSSCLCLCLCSLRSNCSFCFCHILHRWSVTLCAPPHAAHLLGPPKQSLVSCAPAHLPHLGLVALHLL